MAETSKKITAAVGGNKTRAIIFVVMLLLIAILLGFYLFLRDTRPGIGAGSGVTSAPTGLRFLPGVGDPSAQYVKGTQQYNIQKAQVASRDGGSAVPTITRIGLVGTGLDAGKSDEIRPGCSVQDLQRARAAGVQASELRCKGCSASQLKSAGYSAGDLRAAGFSAKALKTAGFTAAELKNAGYTAKDLAKAGFSANDLVKAGYTAGELKDAGFTAKQLLQAGMSAKQLRDGGYSAEALNAAGVTPAELSAAGYNDAQNCSVAALTKARQNGVSASQLKQCGAAALKAAGYSARDLKDAGFSAAELKAAGFTAGQLKAAGFTAKQLKDAGFTAGELKAAGFTAAQLKAAGFSAAQLRAAGFTAAQLKAAGFTDAQLKAAGFSTGEMTRAGIEPTVALTPAREPTATPASATTQAPALGSLEALKQQQAVEVLAQGQQEAVQQLQAAMGAQAADLFQAWSPPPQQQMVMAVQDKGSDTSVTEGGLSTLAQSQSQAAIVKAGGILFATLDTGVNSDEQSPVLATIVTGPLKGSKLVGAFNRTGGKVILQFNLMSIPSQPSSVSVSAVAIDADTARTALATSVDNHYLKRYGTLFASSFLEGLGKAIQTSGSTVTVSTSTTQNATPPLGTTDKALVALGEVGTQLSDQLGNIFDTPPTVEVAAGSGIGILFMSDLTLQGSSSAQAASPQAASAQAPVASATAIGQQAAAATSATGK